MTEQAVKVTLGCPVMVACRLGSVHVRNRSVSLVAKRIAHIPTALDIEMTIRMPLTQTA